MEGESRSQEVAAHLQEIRLEEEGGIGSLEEVRPEEEMGGPRAEGMEGLKEDLVHQGKVALAFHVRRELNSVSLEV